MKIFEGQNRNTIWNAIFGVSLIAFAMLFSFGAVAIHVA